MSHTSDPFDTCSTAETLYGMGETSNAFDEVVTTTATTAQNTPATDIPEFTTLDKIKGCVCVITIIVTIVALLGCVGYVFVTYMMMMT